MDTQTQGTFGAKPRLLGSLRGFLGYLRRELGWAWTTSVTWLRLLRRDRRAAWQQLRQGVRSEEFRTRAGLWYANTTFAYHGMRVTLPWFAGLVTGLYYALNKTSLTQSIVLGVFTYWLTRCLLKLLPFALLAAAPLLLFFAFRSALPAILPSPPDSVPEVSAGFEDAANEPQPEARDATAVVSPSSGEDLLAPENRLSENGAMREQFEESQQHFLGKVFASDGSVVLRDEADLAIVSTWVDHIRSSQETIATYARARERLLTLATIMSREALFELGILDGGTGDTWLDALEDIRRMNGSYDEGATTNDNGRVDQYGRPLAPPGSLTLVNPRGAGLIFIKPHALVDMPAPGMSCAIANAIFKRYHDATKDRDLAKSWQLVCDTTPHLAPFSMHTWFGFNLDSMQALPLDTIERAIMAGEVQDTTAMQLAACYAAHKAAIAEYTDYIAHQQKVMRFFQHVLKTAHAEVRRQAQQEQEEFIKNYKPGSRNLDDSVQSNRLRNALRPAGPGTLDHGTKTLAQRRAELKAIILASVPTEKRAW